MAFCSQKRTECFITETVSVVMVSLRHFKNRGHMNTRTRIEQLEELEPKDYRSQESRSYAMELLRALKRLEKYEEMHRTIVKAVDLS